MAVSIAGQPRSGCHTAQLQFPPEYGQSTKTSCETETIAALSDTNFLAAWDGLLTAVSNHLATKGAYDVVKLLRLTGINQTSDGTAFARADNEHPN
jgi:hypothetical protein